MLVSILVIASIAAVSAVSPNCGNGIINPPSEECDDGNNDDGDGCASNCKIETIGGNSSSGSIWTTNGDCGDETQDENQYAIGGTIFVNGAGFDAGDYDWEIKGLGGSENSGASCDPDAVVALGSHTVDSTGNFCFNAYTVANDDWGEYKVDFSNKHDNYRVNLGLPVIPEFGTTVGILTALSAVGVFFLVRRQ